MLGGVNAESGDAIADQLVQVGSKRLLDFVRLGSQIFKSKQVALEDLELVVEVLNPPIARWAFADLEVEVAGVVVGIVVRTVIGSAIGGVSLAGHVIDYGVDIDLDAGPCGICQPSL